MCVRFSLYMSNRNRAIFILTIASATVDQCYIYMLIGLRDWTAVVLPAITARDR